MKLVDLAAKGWEVVEDIGPLPNLDVSRLKYRSFLEDGERGIRGEEMRRRAVAMRANLGFVDGQLLLAQQDQIPLELRGFYIPLPGTLLRHGPSGGLYIVSLYFDGQHWSYYFDWLGLVWRDRGRFACREE